MLVKDCQTKKLFIETAVKVLLAEGRIYVMANDIADSAGVNRTLKEKYFKNDRINKY
jgi:hypothetical protein